MFSVTYTGMNFFPLCTAMVCPTISGITVDRRDHVLTTFFSLARFIDSTFSSNAVSTNGPFFNERLIAAFPAVVGRVLFFRPGVRRVYEARPALRTLFRAPLHNEPIRVLPATRLVTLGRLA